ncbi:hypothetical protein [Streptococcus dysgalactiae]
MIPRFEKAYEVGHYLAKEAAQQIAGAVNTSDFPTDSQPFLLFNNSGHSKTSVAEFSLTWKKYHFGQRFPKEVYQEAQEYLAGLFQSFQVIDVSGNTISEADILDTSIAFDYDLPKRTLFRHQSEITAINNPPSHVLESLSITTRKRDSSFSNGPTLRQ